MTSVQSRPILLTREGGVLRMSFSYSPELIESMHSLPYAFYDKESRSWVVDITDKSIVMLREMYMSGYTDVSVDDLLSPTETIPPCADGLLRPGSNTRPFVVVSAFRDDTRLKSRLASIPGGRFEKLRRGVSFPQMASSALFELVSRGMISDPENLLSPPETGAVVVAFDPRIGSFLVRGDTRAQVAFSKYFPERDVVRAWYQKGIKVSFSDTFSKEMYLGELARTREAPEIDGIRMPLFPYQKESVAIALERQGLGVFSAPGLGKSLIGIAWAHELMNNKNLYPRTVVVVPGAIRTQWAREIEKFTGSTETVVIDGDKKKRAKLYEEAKTAKWMIVNYDLLASDMKEISPLVSGALLVIDEAHKCKNPTAKRTVALRKLNGKAARRLVMTGTPVENNPGEWYSIISGLVSPGIFGSPADFLGRYSYPGRFGGYEGARNLPELRERSKPLYVRHTKQQVATHLPPLRVQHFPLDPDTSYMAALRRAHREASEEISKERTSRVGLVDDDEYENLQAGSEMTAVGMLRLLCSSPRLLHSSESPAAQALVASNLIPDVDGPKLDKLREIATEMQANGERLVVFTFSKRMADLIAERFKEDGTRFVSFTGETSSKERDAAVEAFTTAGTEADPGPTVFVATDAAAEGLNLGRCCSTLINLDMPWTPAKAIQRSNRIHRLDGTHPKYLVMNMTLRGTLEEGILRMLEQKADLQDALFGENNGRNMTTGRPGRSIYEEALVSWRELPPTA